MEALRIETITISPDSIRSAIQDLERAIDTHTKIKEHLERVLALQKGGSGVGPTRRLGRGRRAKGEKTLRDAIVDVLKKTKKPLKPVELRDRVMTSGYATTATPQSLYTAVFNTARKDPGISKTKEGFQLTKARRGARRKAKKSRKKK